MFLLFNKNFKLKLLLISLIVFTIQINLPPIFLFNYFKVNLDLFLILLTFLVFVRPTFLLIILGFIYGLVNDIVINIEQIGLMSFIKGATVYMLLYIRNYDTIWNWYMKFLVICLIYLIHFGIYFSIIYDYFNIYIFTLSIIQAIISLFVFYIFNKLIFNLK